MVAAKPKRREATPGSAIESTFDRKKQRLNTKSEESAIDDDKARRSRRTPTRPVYTHQLDSDSERSGSEEETSEFEVDDNFDSHGKAIVSDSEREDEELETEDENDDDDEDMADENECDSSDENNSRLRRGQKKSFAANKKKEGSSFHKKSKYQKLLIKPSVPLRETSRKNPQSELEQIREMLHVSYIPDDMPGRDSEFLSIYEYVSEAIEKGGGECICEYITINNLIHVINYL
jgi:hypothetical protein